jgi:hypothetical protein
MIRLLTALILLSSTAFAGGKDPTFLGPGELSLIEEALKSADLRLSDLAVRDGVNGGLQAPRDRWRTASVDAALEDVSFAGAYAAGVERTLASKGPGALPDWSGLWALTDEEFGKPGKDPCEASAATLKSGLGLIDRMLKHAATQGDKWSKRDASDLRARLDDRVDTAVGHLLDEAALAKCRVDASTGRIDAARRAELARLVEQHIAAKSPKDGELDERATALISAWEAVDRPGLLLAGQGWSDAVTEAAVQLSSLAPEAWPTEPVILPTDLGEVWIGSPSHNSGTGDPVLLVDPGGDDQWRLGIDTPLESTRTVAGWIDLGGDDLWLSRSGGPGGAFFSVAAGVDAGGDDTHRGDVAVQGGAAFGVATWHDARGKDVFRAAGLAQGAALFGVGALRAGGYGSDTFDATSHAQGVGLPGGLGLAMGSGSDDSWTLSRGHGQGSSAGVSLRLGGGVGLLVERGGDDTYVAGAASQGAAALGGLGIFVERSGDDRYLAGAGSQGACSWAGVGLLADRGGDDSYQGGARSQGVAAGACQGWLLEAEGDDRYAATPTSLDLGGVGVLVDSAGGATLAGTMAQAGRGLTVRALSGGNLLDSSRPRGLNGSDVDLLRPEFAPPARTESVREFSLTASSVIGKSDYLALLHDAPPDADAAWAWGQRLHLASGSAGVFEWAAEVADELRPHEALAVEASLHHLVARKDPTALSALVKSVSARASSAPRDGADPAAALPLRWLAHVLSADLVPPDAAVDAAAPLVDHPAWPVRAAAFDVLSAGARRAATEGLSLKSFGPASKRATVAVGSDRVAEVRAAAARFLGYSAQPSAAASLGEVLDGGTRQERAAAELALSLLAVRGGGQEVARAAFKLADRPPSPERNAALRILGATGHPDAADLLREVVETGDPWARVAALVGVAALGPEDALDYLTPLLEVDLHPRVRQELDETIAALAPPED